MREGRSLHIAIVGTGIAGLSAAWLLSKRHKVTIYEQAGRVGGHANTVDVAGVPVDTGFIVYNPPNYPNFTALMQHLGVVTRDTEMSFAVSLRGGAFEYSGASLRALFVQRSNVLRPSFWSMLREVRRFYTTAAMDVEAVAASGQTLGQYLDRNNYARPFVELHLLPMAAAIWSAPATVMLDYPAAAFIRFFKNHGLLDLSQRPPWRTVVGGSKAYVARLTDGFRDQIRTGAAVKHIARSATGVMVSDGRGDAQRFDHVVVATHADQALGLLSDADGDERRLLGAFRYTRNEAVLHGDTRFMPRRRGAWASWNYVGDNAAADGVSGSVGVTYWMNSLQHIGGAQNYFVTLNPSRPPANVMHREIYEHPVFDAATDLAQRQLWSLQGRRNTWFCGAYFGAGFHEDGLQAGLAVAEDLGGRLRPWQVANESGRIHRGAARAAPTARQTELMS